MATSGGERHPLAVVVPYWLDRPPLEALDVLTAAQDVGVGAAWIGEMLSFDAFALAGAAARETRLHLTVGPLGVGIRTVAGIAMGVASLQALAGADRVALALGSSTRVVTEEWHGREWSDLESRLSRSAQAVRSLLAGRRVDLDGPVRTRGFRLGLPSTVPEVGMAAFGPRSTAVAGRLADRLVLNLVTEVQVRAQVERVPDGMPVTAWVVAGVDPSPRALDQVRRQVAMYLGAPGYGEMFTQAGFGTIVDLARSGAPLPDVVAAVTSDLIESVAMIGSRRDIGDRLAGYRAAGVSQVAVVPVTADDDGGRQTLAAVVEVS